MGAGALAAAIVTATDPRHKTSACMNINMQAPPQKKMNACSDTSRQFYFQFHITHCCNLRCKHCYQEGYEATNISVEQKLIEIAEKIDQTVTKWKMKSRVALTGGEPFLSSELWPLLDFFQKKESTATLTILSNGTLITNEIAKRCTQYSKLREVQISLDGADSSSHDYIRGEGAFSKAINGIRHLREHEIPVAIMFTLMRSNIGQIEDILNLAERERVNYLTIERVVPAPGSDLNKVDVLTPSEIKTVYTFINAWCNQKKRYVSVRRRRPLWALVSAECGGFCPVGFSALAVLEDGTILPCRRLEIPIGNVFQDSGFFKAWYTSDLLWKIRNRSNLKGKCKTCSQLEKCSGCRAIAYCLTNDYLEGDPQCWM